MVLGEVEETITMVDVNEETLEEVIRVNISLFMSYFIFNFINVDCKENF